MDGDTRLRKLKWLCRRGMRELDILLACFIEKNGRSLAEGEWPEFESLLQLEDDRLWDWLQDTSAADAEAYRKVLFAIRGVAD